MAKMNSRHEREREKGGIEVSWTEGESEERKKIGRKGEEKGQSHGEKRKGDSLWGRTNREKENGERSAKS